MEDRLAPPREVEVARDRGQRLREVDDVFSVGTSGFAVADSTIAGSEFYGLGALVLVEGRAKALNRMGWIGSVRICLDSFRL